MSLGLRRLAAATAGALTVALTLGSTAPAYAQIDTSSIGPEEFETILEVAGSLPLGSTVGLAGSVGSADFPLGAGSSVPIGTPSEVDTSITQTEFRGIERTRAGGYEYWIVASRAMQREITVEVVPSRGEGPAPVLYMLDGVGSPVNSTGWAHQAHIADRMADENVHVVNPAGAFASYFTDWEKTDPVLGHNKWETFLTEELPGVIASELESRDFELNGKSAISGISMGAQGAMHLAATHDIYDAVMSFSGYYSTMDDLGYQNIRLAVETRGGDVDNMWGARGSDRWKQNDTISHPQGLKGKAVYFSAGNGEIGQDDLEVYGTDAQDMLIGLVLERGVLDGTKKFEQALDRAGIEHKVDYSPTGLHNWKNFLKNFDAGWAHIKPALQG